MILRYESMSDSTYKHYFDSLNELFKAGILQDEGYWQSIDILNKYWKDVNLK